jgi:hypothetical protein
VNVVSLRCVVITIGVSRPKGGSSNSRNQAS